MVYSHRNMIFEILIIFGVLSFTNTWAKIFSLSVLA